MTGHTLVFLGPSLPRDRAVACCPSATFLPPAGQGDFYRVLAQPVRRLILLDGVFHARAAVWQREILAALDSGLEVIGASSMGALRAAETAPFGMLGIGTIFAGYCNGSLDGDDEVALLHGDETHGWRPLSVPLVNIRATLDAARRDGLVDAQEQQRLIALAKAMPYAERVWSQLWHVAKRAEDDALARFVAHKTVDLKAEDAVRCLRWAEARPPQPRSVPQRARRQPTFQRDRFHEKAILAATGFLTNAGTLQSGNTLLRQWRDDGTWATLQKQHLNEWTCRTLLIHPDQPLPTDEELAVFLQHHPHYAPVPDARTCARRGLTPIAWRRALSKRMAYEKLLTQTLRSGRCRPAAHQAAELWQQPVDAVERAFAAAVLLGDWAAKQGIQAPPDACAGFERHLEPVRQSLLENLTQGDPAQLLDRLSLGTWVLGKGPAHFGIIHPSETIGILEEGQLRGQIPPEDNPAHRGPEHNETPQAAVGRPARSAPAPIGPSPFGAPPQKPVPFAGTARPQTHLPFQTSTASGTLRIRPPATTLERMRPHWGRFGITRLADVTRLDLDFGVPTYCAVRPNAHVLQTANGKGLSHDAAKVSALMEAVELWHAEQPPSDLTITHAHALESAGKKVIPWPANRNAARSAGERHMAWVDAQSLDGRETAWLPADMIWFMQPSFGRTTTNGLASGNHRREAEIHAVYELLERDALARLDQHGALQTQHCPIMDPHSLPPGPLADLVARIEHQGCRLALLLPPTRAQRVTVWAVLIDPNPAARVSTVNSGAGCHHHLDIALSRAVTEAVQSRLSFIHGGREDIGHKAVVGGQHQSGAAVIEHFQRLKPTCRYTDLSDSSKECDHLDQCHQHLIEDLRADGIQAWSVRLTKNRLPIEVVKVVAPGLALNPLLA